MKRILSILLCLVVCMAMMPVGEVFAAENYGWKIGDKDVVVGTNSNSYITKGTVTYDAGSNTLTLNNASITVTGNAAITCGGTNPKIVVKGTNTVTSEDKNGIYSNAALAIEGSGNDAKLTVKSNAAKSNSEGIDCRSNLNIINMDLEAETTSTNGRGIYCEYTLRIEKSIVTAKAENATGDFCAIGTGYGIVAEMTSIAPEGFVSGITKVTGKNATFDNRTAIYDLWVGGVRVNETNATDIKGDGIKLGTNGKVLYDNDSSTLTLNNAEITGSYEENGKTAAVLALMKDSQNIYKDLNIKLIGTSKITNPTTSTDKTIADYGIYSPKSISVTKGDTTDSAASVTIESNDDAIHSGNTTAFSNVTVTATSTTGDGIYSDYNITIEKANVVAKGVNGIKSGYDITAEPNSTVQAEGTTGHGIVAINKISLLNSDIEAKCTSGDAIVSEYGKITCTAEMSPIKNGTNVYAENEPTHIIKALKADEWVSLKRTTHPLYYNTADGYVYTSYNEQDNKFSDKWDRGGITGSGNTLTLKNFYFVTTADKALVIPGEKTDTITINCEGNNIICAGYGYNGDEEDYGIKTDANLIINGGSLSMAYSDVYTNIDAGGDIQLVDTDVTVRRFITGGKLTLENAILYIMNGSTDTGKYNIETGAGIYYYNDLYVDGNKDCQTLSGSNTIAKLGNSSLTLYSEAFAYFNVNGGKWEDGNDHAIIRSESKQEDKRWITIPDEPTKDGYNFIGWFTAADGGTQITGDKVEYKIEATPTALVKDHKFGGYAEDAANTYYAHWKAQCTGEHTFGDWQITKQPTATEKGSKERVCSECQYKETQEIPATGGSSGGAALPAEDDVKTNTDGTTSETTTSTTVKETKTETVKDENGKDVTKTTATVSDKVADKLVDQAVSNNSDTVEITVKSNTENKVDSEKQVELEIPKSAVKDIADKTDASLVINTDNGQVVLDNKTLETIASETEGDTVRIVVNENTQLTESQEPAAEAIGDNGHIFDLRAYIGDKLLHGFKGGKAHVTLPMPEKLKGKDVVVIYINDKGICEILNHTMEEIGADSYIRFTTTHFSTFAVVERADAERIIARQNQDKAKDLIKEAKLKASTAKTTKKNVKVTVRADNSLIKELKDMGYTVKYKYYRSTKKASKYSAVKTKAGYTYINTKGKKGSRYYYKARVLVYEGKKLIAQTELKQCSYGMRVWSK